MPATVSKFEDALQYLITALAAADGAAPYQVDIKHVHRLYKLPHRMDAALLPFFGIAGTRRVLAPDATRVVRTYSWDWKIYLHGFAADGETLSKIEADVETVLELDRTLGGYVDDVGVTDVVQTTEISHEVVSFAMLKMELTAIVEHNEGDVTA